MSQSKLVIAVILLLAGAALIAWRYRDTPSPESRYRLAAVERGDIRQTVSANGTLNPVVLVNVGTQVSGTVQRLYADFNDRVTAGQVLAELDPSLFQAQLAQSRANIANAQAALKLAQANEKRVRALYGQDYVARAELDQAEQALGAARAQLALAEAQSRRDQTNLRYSVIVSPVSGVVVSRNVDVGQTVAASFQTPTLFSIAQDLRRMQIHTAVAEADVGGVRVGQAVHFSVDAFPERGFQGVVGQIRLNSQVQQNVVTYDVVVDVDNADQTLLPGMTAFVNIVVAERHDVLRVPLPALRYKPSGETAPAGRKPAETRVGEKTVYRLEQDQAVPVALRIGIADGKFAEQTTGPLQAGDKLVVEELQASKREGAPGGSPGGAFRFRMF
ncbi:MAG: efflux RND transporter periplasmic adaptor subunit [Methylococcaceae bacterium]|nr:MAG: efflux RND transporter periplasmic adaptor subunit [Methylococcaceae bacterium]